MHRCSSSPRERVSVAVGVAVRLAMSRCNECARRSKHRKPVCERSENEAARLTSPEATHPGRRCYCRSKQTPDIHRSLLAISPLKASCQGGYVTGTRSFRANLSAHKAQLSSYCSYLVFLHEGVKDLWKAHKPRSYEAAGHAPAKEREFPHGATDPWQEEWGRENSAAPVISHLGRPRGRKNFAGA